MIFIGVHIAFLERWCRRKKNWRSAGKRVANALADDPSKKLQYRGLIAKGYVPLLP